MNTRQLLAQLKQGIIGPVYLFSVADDYVGRTYLKHLRDAAVDPDATSLNVSVFNEKGTDIAEVLGLARTLPFMASRRFIVLEADAWQKNEAASKAIVPYIADPARGTVFVLYGPVPDKRSAIYKAVDASAHVVDIPRATYSELAKWIGETLAKKSMKIDPDALDSFISAGDYLSRNSKADSGYYAAEMAKFAEMGIKTVTLSTVRDNVSTNVSEDVFALSDSVMKAQVSKALLAAFRLEQSRVNEMRALSELARSFRVFALVNALFQSGVTEGEISKQTGFHSYPVKKALDSARHYSVREALAGLVAIERAEAAIKTGAIDPEFALSALIVDLCKKSFTLART